MAVAVKSTQSKVHRCKQCGNLPVWIRSGTSRFNERFVSSCLCGITEYGPGPKWLGVLDWNHQNPLT